MSIRKFDPTGRMGESTAEYEVMRQLDWIYRHQPPPDYGVDGHIELTDHHTEPTGRLLGVQVKAGHASKNSVYFRRPVPGGWRVTLKSKHVEYWQAHTLPMFILLIDLDGPQVYWQELNSDTIETGPRGGRSVVVPSDQLLGTARDRMTTAAQNPLQRAPILFEENLELLPPRTRSSIRALRTAGKPNRVASAGVVCEPVTA